MSINPHKREALVRLHNRQKQHRQIFLRGVTLVEMVVVVSILGILMMIAVNFFNVGTRALIQAESNTEVAELLRGGLTTLEFDLKDMNEVVYANRERLDFYMDYSRHPNYKPNDDLDGDGVINQWDPDDDNDGWSGLRTAWDFLALPQGVAGTGWRQGMDIDDDDDNNDGFRDVLCRYSFNSSKKTLERQFSYDGGNGWTDASVVLRRLDEFSFHYAGRLNAPGIPPGTDGSLTGNPEDGTIDEAELDSLDGTPKSPNFVPLENFKERVGIGTIEYRLTIPPLLKTGKPTKAQGVVTPPLLGVKEKFQ